MTVIAREQGDRGDPLESNFAYPFDCFVTTPNNLNPFTSSFPKSYAYCYPLSRWKLNFQYRSSSPRSWLYQSHRHWCSRIANYPSPSWKRNPCYHWTLKIPTESWWHTHLFRSNERKPRSSICFSTQKGTAFSDEDLELFWIPWRAYQIFSYRWFCRDKWEIKLYFPCYYYREEADSWAGTWNRRSASSWSEQ